MTRDQRFRYEMFVRVRDFGTAHKDLFPESSSGGETFAQVTAAVAAIDAHVKDRILGRAEARRVKTTTRAAVFEGMKTIALAARRVTRSEPGTSPFVMPRRRALQVEIATAEVFIAEAERRQESFARFGLPAAFMAQFKAQVEQMQQAVNVRRNSRTVRGEAKAGIEVRLVAGLDAIRDLDAIVTIATRQDPVRFAAWRSARRIEGQGTLPAVKAAIRPVAVPGVDAAATVATTPEIAVAPAVAPANEALAAGAPAAVVTPAPAPPAVSTLKPILTANELMERAS